MAFSVKYIYFKIYAPALEEEDDGRPVVVVHAMERALSGLRLDWTVSDDHQMVFRPQRDAWLAQAIKDGGFPLVCNNDESRPIMVSGMEYPANYSPGGRALLNVHARVPLDAGGIAAVADVLEGVAEGARAFWAHASLDGYGLVLAEQARHSPSDPDVTPRGLPAVRLGWQLPSPEIPQYLGWVNYWSAAAARIIGFPDPARDGDLLSRARRTATGGWVVRLTDAPLDLDNPAHLDALRRAYERFPEIGGRSAP
jgi:hypothetical protein